MNKTKIQRILDLLRKTYGARQFKPHHDPISELVLTILSQNTSDANSRPAFQALKSTFKRWENILDASTEDIAEVIKGGGLGQIKAQRIKESLREIQNRRGELDLNFLEKLPVSESREWLKALPGVGNKTANCVLLFALGKPALPVDTHIFRVSKRLGLIREKADLDEAHLKLELMVSPDANYEFHVLMIEHGRKTCLSHRPRCLQCALKPVCPSYDKFIGSDIDKKD